MLGIPYVGHNPLNSSILDQKHIFKRELQAQEINTPSFITWHINQGSFHPHLSESFAKVFADYKGSFLVKPVSGRASLNIHYVETSDGLTAAIENVHKTTNSTALIEAYCPGREFCVSVCGSIVYANQRFYRKSKPFAFSILERRLEPGEHIFTSMDKRAITSDRIRSLDDELELKQKLAEIAQKIYQNLYLNTLIRVDLRADQNGTLQVLEANPKPDLKRSNGSVTSLVAHGLSGYGMSYEDLILTLLSDRLNYLFTYHSKTIQHIVKLIDEPSIGL